MMPKGCWRAESQKWPTGPLPRSGGWERAAGWGRRTGADRATLACLLLGKVREEGKLALGGRDQGPSTSFPSAWIWNPEQAPHASEDSLVYKAGAGKGFSSQAELLPLVTQPWPQGAVSPGSLGVRSGVQKRKEHWLCSSDLH